jgi:uncharacterized membrane protein YdjX (TVP38/TMEM64 family)
MRRFLSWRLLALFVVADLIAVAFLTLPGLRETLYDLTEWVREHQTLGAVVLGALYIPAAVLLVPGSPITLVAGYALGLSVGIVAMSIGSTLGACAAFWAGRTIARGWVEKKIAGNPRFQALDRGVAEAGFKIVLLTRLSPIFPYNLLNYAFGLTRVRFRDYLLASWIGMLPGTFMYVYLGTTFGTIADLTSGRRDVTLSEKILYVVGLVATIVIAVLIGRIARNALRKTAPQLEATPAETTHEPAESGPPR